MGKCLSCCRINQPPDFKGDDEKFTNVSQKEEPITHGPEMSASISNQRQSGNAELLIATNSNGDSSCLNNVKPPNSERRMFCRIPPILSSSSSDSKRSSHHSREYSDSKISALFEQYKDPSENVIFADGIERLCSDLNIQPEEFKTLLLAWKFNAQQMCCFTKEEFIEGCRNLRSDSIHNIQARFPDMLKEIQDHEKFKDFYRFTFRFGLEAGQRVLMSDMAIQLWKLVFHYNEPPILQRWLAFLEKHPSVRSISRDTWNMFLNFSEAVGEDLSSYDDAEAWPSLFDDFVEYENDQTNQNILPSKDKCVVEM